MKIETKSEVGEAFHNPTCVRGT